LLTIINNIVLKNFNIKLNDKMHFLDRDAVINKDTGYFYEFSKIIWNKKIFKTIKFIKKKYV
jgi:histidinol phosphatase-like enzyme